MAIELYHSLIFLHVLAALFWLGGMFFLAAVGAPVLRKVEPPELRARLFHDLGVAFRRSGWPAIGVLLFTGIWILHLRGVLRWEVLGDPSWWGTSYGRALLWKLLMVVVMIVVSAVHDFVVGPMAARGDKVRRWAALLARGNAVAGLILVYWATRLARGG